MIKKNIKIRIDLNPEFNPLVTAMRLRIPNMVPVVEHSVDTLIKELSIGIRIETVADEVDFCYYAEYDYTWIRVTYDIDNLFSSAYDSGTGQSLPSVKTMHDCETYPWRLYWFLCQYHSV
jgi:hypothetical protein